MIVLAMAVAASPAGSVAAETRPTLDGHWQCSGPKLPATQRSYFTLQKDRDAHPTRETFGTADRLERGAPATSFEHIVELADHSFVVDSVEGNGFTSGNAEFPLRFVGRSFDGATTFTLTYELSGATLHRVAKREETVVDDEQCTREPDPAPTTCPRPNVPASVIKADEPSYPVAGIPSRASGLVHVRVVLDDRSRVLWVDILSSTNPVFNDSARIAARDSTYRTEVRDCRPRAAVYVFTVEYSGR